MNNYPDDIRNYDNHPGSPFYEAPPVKCSVCTKLFDGDNSETSQHDEEKLLCSEECLEEFNEEYEADHSCNDCEKLECECE